MKKTRLLKYIKHNPSFKRCPNGGVCFNPICMFGCVESY